MRDNQTGPINHTNDVNIKDQNINRTIKPTLNLIDILVAFPNRVLLRKVSIRSSP